MSAGGFRGRHTRSSGAFSLVELMIVLLIVGTLALAAGPSIHRNLLECELDRAAAEVISLIRYARSLSVTGTPHWVGFDEVANSVAVVNSSTLAPAEHPMRKQHDCILDLGAGRNFEHVDLVSADFSGDDKVVFDRLGNASSGGTVVLRAGGMDRTIRVSGPTGGAHIEQLGESH